MTYDDEEGRALFRWVELRTRNLLNVPVRWCVVRRLAAALLANKRLTRDQIVEACTITGRLDNPRPVSEVEAEIEAAERHLRRIERRRSRASRRRRPGPAK